MFPALTTSQILTIVIATVIFYAIIVAFAYAKKYWAAGKLPLPAVPAPTSASLIGAAADTPAQHPITPYTNTGHSIKEEDDTDQSFDEDSIPEYKLPFAEEQQVTLLKEAERVVEEIQQAIDHRSNHPANPEEVFMKIQAIVSEYSFFFDTEYYDAINRFISVTVQRDCDLQLTEDEIKSLWFAAAA